MENVNRTWIVDDDEIFRYIMKKQITTLNFSDNIESYVNGKEAIHELKRRVESNESLPDVIFLDINMPIMTGWDFMEEFNKLRAAKNSIRIYMVSSSVDVRDLEKASEMTSITDYIVKPMENHKMLELMKNTAA